MLGLGHHPSGKRYPVRDVPVIGAFAIPRVPPPSPVWLKWSGGTEEHFGCKWLRRGTPSAGNGARAPRCPAFCILLLGSEFYKEGIASGAVDFVDFIWRYSSKPGRFAKPGRFNWPSLEPTRGAYIELLPRDVFGLRKYSDGHSGYYRNDIFRKMG